MKWKVGSGSAFKWKAGSGSAFEWCGSATPVLNEVKILAKKFFYIFSTKNISLLIYGPLLFICIYFPVLLLRVFLCRMPGFFFLSVIFPVFFPPFSSAPVEKHSVPWSVRCRSVYVLDLHACTYISKMRKVFYFRSAESAFLPKNERGSLALYSSWRQEGITGLLSTLTGKKKIFRILTRLCSKSSKSCVFVPHMLNCMVKKGHASVLYLKYNIEILYCMCWGMEGCKLVSRLAGSLLALWRLSFTLHTTFHPHLRMSTDVRRSHGVCPYLFILFNSVADPGCLSRIRVISIPDPNFFYPGSASKNLNIFSPKNSF